MHYYLNASKKFIRKYLLMLRLPFTEYFWNYGDYKTNMTPKMQSLLDDFIDHFLKCDVEDVEYRFLESGYGLLIDKTTIQAQTKRVRKGSFCIIDGYSRKAPCSADSGVPIHNPPRWLRLRMEKLVNRFRQIENENANRKAEESLELVIANHLTRNL